MSELTRIPGARLVCVSISKVNRSLNAPPMPGLYFVLWEVEGTAEAMKDAVTLHIMSHHYLQGKVICAN